MKKVVVNLNDFAYEKLLLESVEKGKNISEVIADRILEKPFSAQVIETADKNLQSAFNKLCKE